mmetsp:Transcript_16812/g.25414  ORF Transcript_16812/g.25414 Transcript_16812/m.25414 type:complete len:182 (+) Transcript_16812:65-610(+)
MYSMQARHIIMYPATLIILLITSCESFVRHDRLRIVVSETEKLWPLFEGDYFEQEDDRDREFARIRRGRRQDRYEQDRYEQDPYERDGTVFEEEDEYSRTVDQLYDKIYDQDEDDYDGVIPNPLLDNIDPEGSAERAGELFADPKFWRDIIIFLLALNFLDNLEAPMIFDAIDVETFGNLN